MSGDIVRVHGEAFGTREQSFPCGACRTCLEWAADNDAVARARANGADGFIFGSRKMCLREAEYMKQKSLRFVDGDGG